MAGCGITRRRMRGGQQSARRAATPSGPKNTSKMLANMAARGIASGAVVKAPMGGAKTRKASPWNKFVQKIYQEMKRKQGKAASFSAALKEASRRKSEM